MVTFRQKGDYSKVTKWLERAKESVNLGLLNKYGEKGVAILSAATPKDTGKTASSWSYEIEQGHGRATLTFYNSNIVDDWFSVAIALQYGHGTRNGGWVEGRDYINPAIQPLFDELADEAWREVTK